MFETMLENPIGQAFGIIAMLIAFSGLLQKDDKKTMKIIIFSMFFWMLHFYFMGVYAALVATFIGIIRIFLSLKYKKNKRIFLGIIGATVVGGIMTYENPYSILPIIGSSISAYGYFFFERIRLRMFLFISSIFWFTFNLSNGSIGGILNDIIVQIILIYVMYRLILEEGKKVYYIEKIMSILEKSKPDVGRYLNIYDFIKVNKKNTKERIIILKDKILKRIKSKLIISKNILLKKIKFNK